MAHSDRFLKVEHGAAPVEISIWPRMNISPLTCGAPEPVLETRRADARVIDPTFSPVMSVVEYATASPDSPIRDGGVLFWENFPQSTPGFADK